MRTSLAERQLDAEGAVRAYKRLSAVERAFRSLKTVDLKVQPVFHRTAEPFDILTRPTALQREVFKLLGVRS